MNLALFDFDGTITKKDSWHDFMDFVGKKHRLTGLKMLLFLPIIILDAIGFNTTGKFTELFLMFCFKGWKKEYFDELAKSYAETKLEKLIRQNALEQINKHKINGDKIVVVTASLDSWISDWCKKNEIDLISSILEVNEGLITGKLIGEICSGESKVKRIQEKYDLDNYETVYAYGDTSGDKAMLELADIAYYRWETQAS